MKKKSKISLDSSILKKKKTLSNVNFKNQKDNNIENYLYIPKSYSTRRKSISNKNLLYSNLRDLIEFSDSSFNEDSYHKKSIKSSMYQNKKDVELLFLVNNNINQNLLINNNQNFGNQYLKSMTKGIISQKRSLNSKKFN